MNRPIHAMLLALCAATFLSAQDPPPTEPTQTPAAGGPQRPGGPAAVSQDPQPYDKVITKEAKSKKGLFTVHQIKDKYYYEIPKSEFGKEFLWNSQIARTTMGVGYGGQELASRVVYWELSGNKVHLRDVNYSVVADPKTPISQAVKAANNSSIIMTFPVAAFGTEKDNKSAVIEVTRLFNTDVYEFSARQRLNATTMDASRSYIDRISPYPENIEVEVTHTYTRSATPPGAAATPVNPFSSGGMRPGSATVALHHSMVKLPEKPMKSRLYDDRVGYFTVFQMDYSRDEQRAPQRRYITRWRLEKKDPTAALSEPLKPIVYWIDFATPSNLVPSMISGVEDWQKAFEAAGFKNAILAKPAPP